MNKEKTYWKWKSTIIDFNNISDEKADFGDYWTKKEMVFHYLGTPDDGIHEWYNGGWSTEYNYALSYAKQLGLVEEYRDYDDELFEKQELINKQKEVLDKIKEYCKEVIKEHNNGEYNVSTTQLAIKEHKGNIENILELLEEIE